MNADKKRAAALAKLEAEIREHARLMARMSRLLAVLHRAPTSGLPTPRRRA